MSQSTKEKILNVAGEIFAKKGFDGTSIREIAQTAEVNLAGINYHYENKLGLYIAVFERNYQKLETDIHEIAKTYHKNSEELVEKIFDLFYDQHDALLNNFKMILNATMEIPDSKMEDSNIVGPPGGEAILKVINNEVGEDVEIELRLWAARTLFTHIIHYSLMIKTSLAQKCQNRVDFTPEYVKLSLIHLCRSLIKHIKENPTFSR